MRLGLRKIEWIDSALLHDYSMVAPGSTIRLSSYIKNGGQLRPLPFTPETANMEETWQDDTDGIYSYLDFNAAIRRNKDEFKDVLQQLTGKKAVWLLTLNSGVQYIIGSPEFVPSFKYSDSISGQSSSEFSIRISNDSLHGLLKNQPE